MDRTGPGRSGRLLPYDPDDRLAIDDLLGLSSPRERHSLNQPIRESTSDRIHIEVVEIDGRAASVELRVRLDTVEVVHHGQLVAVFDLDALREWWTAPQGPFGIDQVTWTVDYTIDVRGRAAITLPMVEAWALSPQDDQEVARRLKCSLFLGD